MELPIVDNQEFKKHCESIHADALYRYPEIACATAGCFWHQGLSLSMHFQSALKYLVAHQEKNKHEPYYFSSGRKYQDDSFVKLSVNADRLF